MQCSNPKAVASMMKVFTEARDSVSVLKFDGKLAPVNKNDKELDLEAFILTIELFVGEYGQQNFHFIEIGGKVVNVLENYHMVSVEDKIASYEACMTLVNQNLLTVLKRMT